MAFLFLNVKLKIRIHIDIFESYRDGALSRLVQSAVVI